MPSPMIEQLKTLYRNAKEEFRTQPVRFLGSVVAILAVLLPIVSNLLPTGISSHPIIRSMLIRQDMNSPLIILSLILLAWSYIILRKERIHPESVFVTYRDATWKIINPKAPDKFSIEEIPYCKKHKVQMVPDDIDLRCPICKTQVLSSQKDYSDRRAALKVILSARLNNHLSNADDSSLTFDPDSDLYPGKK